MADLWRQLFDHDWRQRDDIDAAQVQADVALGEAVRLARRVQRAEERADRAELLLEALVTWLELRGELDRDELRVLAQRLDLADGHEDGRIGPDRSRSAPRCGSCGRPANPRREACLYCGVRLDVVAEAAPPVRTVACRSCGAAVAEDEVLFSELGMICGGCFSG